MEPMNLSKAMQQMLNRAEELDWNYMKYEVSNQNDKMYIELQKFSPAGEDFLITIDFDADAENQAESFLENLRDYADDFDVDEHIEMWIPKRGEGGCPSSVRELVEDAEAIARMLKELYENLNNILNPELSDEQSERCDEIYNAVYEMCKVVAEDENLEWDMHYLGEIAELAADMMVEKGYKVRFPAIVMEQDGFQHIEEYYE